MQMYNEFRLEVANTCEALGLLEGDEVVYSPQATPRSNGKDLAVMEIKGETVVAVYTKYGTQYIVIGDRIQVYPHHQVRIVGKVVGGSHVDAKKPTAATVGSFVQSAN